MIEKIDTSFEAVAKTGRAFLIAGCTFGAIFFLSHSHTGGWTGWAWQQGFESHVWRWFLGLGLGLGILGVNRFGYPLMKPIHFGWMTFAQVLGWFSTRVLLGVFFYLVISTVGLIMRLMGKDLLDQKISKSTKSYWIKRDLKTFDAKHAARPF